MWKPTSSECLPATFTDCRRHIDGVIRLRHCQICRTLYAISSDLGSDHSHNLFFCLPKKHSDHTTPSPLCFPPPFPTIHFYLSFNSPHIPIFGSPISRHISQCQLRSLEPQTELLEPQLRRSADRHLKGRNSKNKPNFELLN